MDKLEAALRGLADSPQSINKTARLRAMLPLIEELQRLGIKQKDIVARLNAEGFKITESGFRNTLSRIRSKLDKTEQPAPAPVQMPAQATVQPVATQQAAPATTATATAEQTQPAQAKKSARELLGNDEHPIQKIQHQLRGSNENE